MINSFVYENNENSFPNARKKTYSRLLKTFWQKLEESNFEVNHSVIEVIQQMRLQTCRERLIGVAGVVNVRTKGLEAYVYQKRV